VLSEGGKYLLPLQWQLPKPDFFFATYRQRSWELMKEMLSAPHVLSRSLAMQQKTPPGLCFIPWEPGVPAALLPWAAGHQRG